MLSVSGSRGATEWTKGGVNMIEGFIALFIVLAAWGAIAAIAVAMIAYVLFKEARNEEG